jgi:hypothetical protein
MFALMFCFHNLYLQQNIREGKSSKTKQRKSSLILVVLLRLFFFFIQWLTTPGGEATSCPSMAMAPISFFLLFYPQLFSLLLCPLCSFRPCATSCSVLHQKKSLVLGSRCVSCGHISSVAEAVSWLSIRRRCSEDIQH